MTDTTTVNDNRVDFGASARGNGGDVRARRLAADLPRGDGRIDRVRSSVRHYAVVWLADGKTEYRPPEGFRIAKVFRSSNDDVAVCVEQVDA